MTKKKYKLLSVFLSLCMIVSCMVGMSVTAGASNPDDETYNVSNAQQFLTVVGYGGEIKLTDSFTLTLTDKLYFEDALILDLNGKTLTVNQSGTSSIWKIDDAVTIKDGSTGGEGKIIHNGSNYCNILINDGPLTLVGGTLEFTNSGTKGIDVYDDTFTMTGGTINSANYSIEIESPKVTISGGTIIGGFYGTNDDDCDLEITGGSFSFDPSGLLAEGYSAKKDGNYWVVGEASTYMIDIPATLNVTKAGWNSIGNLTASGNIADGKKLVITATSANSWNLKKSDTDDKVAYKLAGSSESQKTYADATQKTSFSFAKTELEAQSGASAAVGIVVEPYMGIKAPGTYTDTVTFTASVERAVPEKITITNSAYSGTSDFTTTDGYVNVSFTNPSGNTFGNAGNQDGWYFYGNNSTVTVTANGGYPIDKVKFYTKKGSAEITSAPFTVYSKDYHMYTGMNGAGTDLGDFGVNKIEVYFK